MDRHSKLMSEGRFDEARKMLDEEEAKLLAGIDAGYRQVRAGTKEALDKFDRHSEEMREEFERLPPAQAALVRQQLETARAEIEESIAKASRDEEQAKQDVRENFRQAREFTDQAEREYAEDPESFAGGLNGRRCLLGAG